MAKIDDNIDVINDKIDVEVAKFLEGVDKSQSGIFNKLLSIVKGVETGPDGNIKQTVKNLKLLASVRKTIEKEVITDAYINRVGTLTNQFPAIASLNNGYFETLEAAFDPNKELYKEIVKNSVNATKASLLESGVAENVINPIVNIVDNSVTNGSTFADMVDELRVVIKGDEERLGQLMRYSKQITQDALNQFNAGYNETIAKDLDLEWYFYSGGKRKTSRPFCKKYAGKYFHKKEVEDFGKRKDLDGSNLCTSPNLCEGRVKGTNSSNIFRYRGGYNCKHIYKPTLIDSVPERVVKRNIEKGYYEAEGEKVIKKPVEKEPTPKKFEPATTKKGAESWAKENIKAAKTVEIDDKLSLKDINRANKQIFELQEKGHLKGSFEFNYKLTKATGKDSVGGSYQPFKHAFKGDSRATLKIAGNFDDIISKSLKKITKTPLEERSRMIRDLDILKKEQINISNIPKEFVTSSDKALFEMNAQRIKGTETLLNGPFSEATIKKRAYSRLSTRAKNLEDAITHEYGHILNADLQVSDKLYNKKITDIIQKIKVKNDYRVDNKGLLHSTNDHFLDKSQSKHFGSVSDYADTNGSEYFAESWLKFNQGEDLKDLDLQDLFKAITE